jgi:lysozyme
MKLSEKGLKALHAREGLILKPYLDTKGVPTIAMGNTYYKDGTKVTMKDAPLTKEQAIELGAIVANDFAKKIKALITSDVNQNQFDALVSLAYNIGINGFKNSTVLRLVNKNPNDPAIEKSFLMWTKNKELIGRRKTEVEQYFKPM